MNSSAPLHLMGILNITPDSCFDLGRYFTFEKAIKRAYEIAEQGADIIDIGGESSRPGAKEVSFQEELTRVIPIIKHLSKKLACTLSIDTTKPEVAKEALKAGVYLLNDVSGFQDPRMRKLAAEFNVDICVMHRQGNAQTMQQNPFYPEGIFEHLKKWFEERISLLLRDKVRLEKIILDPGIGFGKTIEHNLEIYRTLKCLKKHFGLRILLGGSRKSFMGKILNKSYPDLLSATLVMHTIAAIQGVDILRIHDVKEHQDLRTLIYSYQV